MDICGGAGGIRTLDRALQPYNGLANRRLQPLGHSSLEADMPDAGATRKRQFRCREANKIVKSVWLDIGPTADAARGTAVRKDALPEHDRTCALQLGRLLAATDAL